MKRSMSAWLSRNGPVRPRRWMLNPQTKVSRQLCRKAQQVSRPQPRSRRPEAESEPRRLRSELQKSTEFSWRMSQVPARAVAYSSLMSSFMRRGLPNNRQSRKLKNRPLSVLRLDSRNTSRHACSIRNRRFRTFTCTQMPT